MSTGTMHVMDRAGDTEIQWDSRNPDEVQVARAAFNKAKKRGMLAYRTKRRGGRGELLSEFDPDAEKIIIAPISAGG